MIPFVPYPKIAEHIADWRRDEDDVRAHGRLSWVATEKLHGANLCVFFDGRDVGVAKRRAWLGAGDDFFDYRTAIGALLGRVRPLFEGLASASAVWIYGELFGGHYPHAAVPPVAGVEAVQTGVCYCPEVRFAAFDVAVSDATGRRHFLPYAEAEARLVAAGVPVVPRLAVGKLEELAALPATFATRVPRMLGLPDLADNFAEGLVIKPWDVEVSGRPLLKRKHPAFAESRFHGARPWSCAAPPDALDRAERAALSMLTRERAASAQSKIGRIRPANVNAIVTEIEDDVRASLEAQHGDWLLALSCDERDLLFSVVEDGARELVTALFADARDPVLDPARYHVDLALAFIRGRLERDAPPDALVADARANELPLHKFKIKDGPPRVTRVLQELRGLRPSSLLDVGSGRGAFLWPLLGAFPELSVTAIDRLSHRVRDIEAVRAGGVARLAGVEGDVGALPFDDGGFDVVTLLEVLEHLEEPERAAREVLRVGRRCIIASVPSHEDDNPEHLRLFSRASLEALFADAGAESVRIFYVRNHMIAVVS